MGLADEENFDPAELATLRALRGVPMKELLSIADAALYASKHSGRDRYTLGAG